MKNFVSPFLSGDMMPNALQNARCLSAWLTIPMQDECMNFSLGKDVKANVKASVKARYAVQAKSELLNFERACCRRAT